MPSARLAGLLFVLGAAGCASSKQAAASPQDATPPPPPAPAEAPAAPAPAPRRLEGRRLEVLIAAALQPQPAIAVEVRAEGPSVELAIWSIATAAAADVLDPSASDPRGELRVQVAARAGGGLALTFDRAPEGRVVLRYTVRPSNEEPPRPLSSQVDPDRLRASGEAVLAVPDAFDDRRVALGLVVDASALQPRGVASSFGIGGAREIDARGRDLRAATFVAGPLGHAVFETPEGHDEAAWLGYTSFDPRPIAADVAAFRTAVRDVMGDRATAPLTLLVVSDSRPRDAFVATRRAGSVLVHVGVGQPWSAPLRIAVAHEVIHGWIGGELWVGPHEAGREAEAYWFTEGVTRHLARELLLRFGLISPGEYLDEVHSLLGVLATSGLRDRDNASLARSGSAPGALPLLVARGAIHATRVDAALRARSKGARSLEHVLRGLLAQARASRGALPDSAWTDALARELGAGERGAFEREVLEGEGVALPDDALGRCFTPRTRTYEAFDVGFDDGATLASPSRAIVGLRAGGPAERAGLRPGDVVRKIELAAGDPRVPVVVKIEREGAPLELGYRPAGASRRAQGFARNRAVEDDACPR